MKRKRSIRMDAYYSIQEPTVMIHERATLRLVGTKKILTLELSDYDVIALRDRLHEIAQKRAKHVEYLLSRMSR